MLLMTRSKLRPVLACCLAWAALLLGSAAVRAQVDLPMSTVFKGRPTFDRLVERAERENWRALPIGERTVRVGLALAGTPYQGYTLEIDNRVE